VHTQGARGLFRGMPAVALGAAPAHAVYFGSYELGKTILIGNRAGHHPLPTAAAGIVATVGFSHCSVALAMLVCDLPMKRETSTQHCGTPQ
jgi:solute carrier family 25 (mitochondrial iron transporter), member 28/37